MSFLLPFRFGLRRSSSHNVTITTAGSERYLSNLASGGASSGTGPGSPLPARLSLASSRHAAGARKSPSVASFRGHAVFSATAAAAEGADAFSLAARSPPAAAMTTALSAASTGNLRRLASEAELRSHSRGLDSQPPPPFPRTAVGAGGGPGRLSLRRHNSLVQDRARGGSSSRGSGVTDAAAHHPSYHHTIGPGSALAPPRASGGTAAAVRKLAGAAMSRERSFLTALSMLGSEDGSGSGGSVDYHQHHAHPSYASPPTTASAAATASRMGSPPILLRSSSVSSSDTAGGFDPSTSPGGMPLLSTSPAPGALIMGPGGRGRAAPSSSATTGAAGAAGSRGYPAGGAETAGGDGGGGGGAGWWEPVNRVVAGLIADAREITELCRYVG